MSLIDAFSSLVSQSAGKSESQPSETQPSTDQHISVTQSLLQHFSEQPGGLGGLLSQFREKGLGGHVDSWLSPQANQPLQPQQVEQTLGQQQMQSVAERAGLSPEIAKIAIAAALPMLISHLSHGSGELPPQTSEGSGLAGLAQSLFAR